MLKRIALVLAALGFICGGPGLFISEAAEAKPAPRPAKTASYYRPVQPAPAVTTTVWVSAQPGLGMAAGTYATGFWNPRTGQTDFTGQLTADGLGWADTPCPAKVSLWVPPCLRVVWANLAEGVYGDYQPVYCSGSCVRQGIIRVNRWGPYFCATDPTCPYEPLYGNENPWNRATIVTHFFGQFIGLAAHPTRDCISIMSPLAWTCSPPRAGDDWLTSAEADFVSAW